VSSQLLVGAVEEGVLPVSRHRSLLRLADDVVVAEGSHWVLLEQADTAGGEPVDLRSYDEQYQRYESGCAARLTSFLAEQPADRSFGLVWNDDMNYSVVRLS